MARAGLADLKSLDRLSRWNQSFQGRAFLGDELHESGALLIVLGFGEETLKAGDVDWHNESNISSAVVAGIGL